MNESDVQKFLKAKQKMKYRKLAIWLPVVLILVYGIIIIFTDFSSPYLNALLVGAVFTGFLNGTGQLDKNDITRDELLDMIERQINSNETALKLMLKLKKI